MRRASDRERKQKEETDMFIRQVEEDERKKRQSRSRNGGASPRRVAGTPASPARQPRRHTGEPEPELQAPAASRKSVPAPAPPAASRKSAPAPPVQPTGAPQAPTIVQYDGKDCSTRYKNKEQLKYGDVVSFVVQNSLQKKAGTSFASTMQNPLYASARLCAFTRDEITRPFSLVAAFEICAAEDDDVEDLIGTRIYFGSRIRLKHRGSGNWLTIE